MILSYHVNRLCNCTDFRSIRLQNNERLKRHMDYDSWTTLYSAYLYNVHYIYLIRVAVYYLEVAVRERSFVKKP